MDKQANRVLVLPSEDGSQYDVYFLIPASMSDDEALRIAAQIVERSWELAVQANCDFDWNAFIGEPMRQAGLMPLKAVRGVQWD